VASLLNELSVLVVDGNLRRDPLVEDDLVELLNVDPLSDSSMS